MCLDKRKVIDDGFILSTAKDYDLTPYVVMSTYNKCIIDYEFDSELFYNELEQIVESYNYNNY